MFVTFFAESSVGTHLDLHAMSSSLLIRDVAESRPINLESRSYFLELKVRVILPRLYMQDVLWHSISAIQVVFDIYAKANSKANY